MLRTVEQLTEYHLQAIKNKDDYVIIKRGFYYKPEECGYTDRPILAGFYNEKEAILISHPNGLDGPRYGMFFKHREEIKDLDFLAFITLLEEMEKGTFAKSRGTRA